MLMAAADPKDWTWTKWREATVQRESVAAQLARLRWRQEAGSPPRPLLDLCSQWSAWTGESAEERLSESWQTAAHSGCNQRNTKRKVSRRFCSILLTLRPRSYLRALDDSPAALAFSKAVLYMLILSSKVCWRLPGAAEDTFTICFWTK